MCLETLSFGLRVNEMQTHSNLQLMLVMQVGQIL
ncbi:hypothetical protein VITU102760_04925 [Vibrio tubiashii]